MHKLVFFCGFFTSFKNIRTSTAR